VLVSARKLAELGVSGDELPEPAQVEIAPRQIQAGEFGESGTVDRTITLGSEVAAGEVARQMES